jgi:hypothetical protein
MPYFIFTCGDLELGSAYGRWLTVLSGRPTFLMFV